MQASYLPFKNSLIHYAVLGEGAEVLLCLHGFAESAESFSALVKHLTNKYTVVLIDMPLHGKTEWNEDLTLTVNDLVEIVQQVPVIGANNFAMLGYSMGGRIALQLYQVMPQRINKLILIAPDGMIINFWYKLATQTKAGNRLFYGVMKKPHIFFMMTSFLQKLSLMNRGVYKYVEQHLKTADMRNRLYTIWTTMRKMKPDMDAVRELIVTYKTPVKLIYGRYDKVIRFTTGEKFINGMEPFCTLKILDCGHRLLHEKNVAEIAAEL